MRDHPLAQLTLSQLRGFYREPEAVFWVFGFPVLLAFALGIAFRNRGPEPLQVGVAAGAGDSAVIASLAASPRLAVQHIGPAEGRRRLAVLEAADALQRAAGRADPLTVREERVTEPGSRYIDFLIPGLLGMNLMGSGMWGVGFAVVSARTKKLLKRFLATPMRRSDYLLSFMLSRLAFLVIEVATLVGFGWLVFGVGVRGSIAALALLSVLGSLAFSGIGMLVASRARTVEAVSGLMNLVMLPMWVLSGTFFSYARFPDAIQPVVRALPLTALNDALRGVMIDGAPLVALAAPVAIVTGWGIASFVVGLRIFRWG
jgi:ABC-type multidrug transport system permease subunit